MLVCCPGNVTLSSLLCCSVVFPTNLPPTHQSTSTTRSTTIYTNTVAKQCHNIRLIGQPPTTLNQFPCDKHSDQLVSVSFPNRQILLILVAAFFIYFVFNKCGVLSRNVSPIFGGPQDYPAVPQIVVSVTEIL